MQTLLKPFFKTFFLAVLSVAPAVWAADPKPATPTSSSAQCPTLLRHTVERLQDEKPQNLCQYAGQVVVVVNTASYCGFTPQYKSLEALYDKYKDKGLVVLGFPSNDFSQEPGNNQKIADFCENTYGVKFPMFSKTTVRGGDASPLFKQLTAQTGQKPRWNFHKYLVSRDGRQVQGFPARVEPDSPAMKRALDLALAAAPSAS
jgi:glutathione peroxidase